MREASVLDTATVEIFVGIFFQCQDCLPFFVSHRFHLFEGHCVCGKVGDFQQGGRFVQLQPDFSGCDGYLSVLVLDIQYGHRAAGIVDQDLCFRFGFRIADNAAIVVLEHAEDVISVEVECHSLVVGEDYVDRCRVDSLHTGYCLSLLGDSHPVSRGNHCHYWRRGQHERHS